MRSTMSSIDSCRLVKVSREQVDAGILLKLVVAIQHQGSSVVLEKVHIVPRAGVLLFVDLGCLFACDLITDDSFLTCDLGTDAVFPDIVSTLVATAVGSCLSLLWLHCAIDTCVFSLSGLSR